MAAGHQSATSPQSPGHLAMTPPTAAKKRKACIQLALIMAFAVMGV
jgi:hypothetical protein